MESKPAIFAIVFGLLALPGCERDGAATASPEEAAKAPATATAGAPEAKEDANGQSLRAALPAEGSACPEGRGPGDKWKVDCNTCYCSEEGKVACTLMACIGDEK